MSMTAAGANGVDPILAGSNLTRRFGGVVAVDDLSFAVKEGTATGIIGPNGAGKTTLINMISGLETPNAGRILLKSVRIDRLRAHAISRLGVGRTFQTVRVFEELTVEENLRVADLYARSAAGRSFADRAAGQLRFVGLEDYAPQKAGELSYGQQKLLEMAMVLMSGPSVLLLDEPVAGVNPVLVEKIRGLLQQLVGRGLTLIVVEHNVPFVVDLCDTVLVMYNGKRLVEGSGSDIQKDERVLEAFLGGSQ